jgi:hypothetical protein
VPVGRQDHRGVPVAPTVLPGRVHQSLDLGLGQVLAGPELAVGKSLGGTCSIYGDWRCRLVMRCAPVTVRIKTLI